MAFLEDKEEPAGGGCVLVIPFWAEAPPIVASGGEE